MGGDLLEHRRFGVARELVHDHTARACACGTRKASERILGAERGPRVACSTWSVAPRACASHSAQPAPFADSG